MEVNVVKKPVVSNTNDEVEIKIYPNIVSDQNECFVQGFVVGDELNYRIIDNIGNLIFQGIVTDGKIDLTNAHNAGNYVIELFNKKGSLGTFKIVKIK